MSSLNSTSPASHKASDRAIIKPWLAFDLLGQLFLLGLLLTFAIVKHLPQRKNPFLINFILAGFLATIPGALLLYAGQQWTDPSQLSAGLCRAQAALIDGISPMWGIAQLALVFDTWSELRSVCLHKRHITRTSAMKYILIFAPYLALWIWVFASFIAAAYSNATPLRGNIFCNTISLASNGVRTYVGIFMLAAGLVQICLEVWVGWYIYSYPTKAQDDPTVWRTSIQFALRVIIYSSLLVVTTTLSAVDPVIKDDATNHTVKLAYEMLTSMNALAIFFAFGTQKSILKAWKFWGRKSDDDEGELRPQGDPHILRNWTSLPTKEPMQFDGKAFDREEKWGVEEKGTGKIGYLKGWLRPGKE